MTQVRFDYWSHIRSHRLWKKLICDTAPCEKIMLPYFTGNTVVRKYFYDKQVIMSDAILQSLFYWQKIGWLLWFGRKGGLECSKYSIFQGRALNPPSNGEEPLLC